MAKDINSPDTATIIPLPESTANVLCLEFRGLVRKEDHIKYLVEPMADSIKQAGWFSLMVYHSPSFMGWEPDAADSSLKSIIDFGRKARKLAYVNPPDKKILQHKLSSVLFSGEVRFFNKEDLNKAIDWVKSDDAA